MATSSFRSTTRRSGKTSPAFGSDPPPPTPRANNHRRVQSLSDFSHRYFSDSGSTTDAHRNRNADGCRPRSRRPSSHYLPSDSESDMDGGQRGFRRSFDVGNGRGFSDTAASNASLQQQPGLRRASSHQEISQCSIKNYHRHKIYYNNFGTNNSKGTIKETIGAVYDQTKCLRRGPHVEDQSFYDAIRTEVRREVTEIRKELELCMKKKCSLVDSPDIEAFANQNKDVIQAMMEIRKEYGTKIKESEKKVRELWSQWAVEERRRLELSKIVNELLPSIEHGSHQQNGSMETQLLSKQLEEDAQTFLEDFISTPDVGLSGDIQDKTNHKEDKNSTSFKSKGQAVKSDGVLHPRLHWESDSLTNGKKTPKKLICGSGELGARLTKRNNLLSMKTRSSVKDSINSTNIAPSTQSNNNVDKDEASNQVRSHRCSKKVPEKVVERRVDFDVHNFLLEKLRYRERVGQGEMILCGLLSFEIH